MSIEQREAAISSIIETPWGSLPAHEAEDVLGAYKLAVLKSPNYGASSGYREKNRGKAEEGLERLGIAWEDRDHVIFYLVQNLPEDRRECRIDQIPHDHYGVVIKPFE